MQLRKKVPAFLLILLLLIAVFGAVTAAYASPSPGSAIVNIETDVTGYLALRQSGSTLQYSRDGGSNWTNYSGSITVTGSGTATQNTILVQSGTHNVTLSGVNIDRSSSGCAFWLQGTSIVNLTLAGTNTLKSGDNCAGLFVPSGTAVTIGGTGSLTATGGYASAGIGGSHDGYDAYSGGSISITSGTVTATGSDGAAGIGGCYYGEGGSISITGGTVTATGSDGGAGIGGGRMSSSGTIWIRGGTVTATGDYGGAGIGSGYYGGDCGTISITGGTVTATGDDYGAGIGNGVGGVSGICHISGGSVIASSICPAATVSATDSTPVYLTTLTLPDGVGDSVTALSLEQSGSAVSFGITDMKADSSGTLYLHLPADADTTASLTAGGTVYSGYYGSVASTSTNVLKMDQDTLTVTGLNSSYTYGDTLSPSASGGSGGGAVTYAYAGTGSTTYSGSTAPTDFGTYTVTATKTADDSYNEAVSTAVPFTIDKAASTVTAIPTASGIAVIGRLSSSALTGGTGSVAGTFAWTNPDTVVSATGDYEVSFTPTSSNYSTSTCTVTVTVTPRITSVATGVIYDLSGASLPQGVTAVSVVASIVPNTGAGAATYTTVGSLIGGISQPLSVSQHLMYDLSLQDQDGNPITGFTGSITVRLPIPAGMSGNLHVYWYDAANGAAVDMNAVQENGYLVFTTTHFSVYSIAELKAVSPKPGTGNSSSLLLPAALLLCSISGLAVSLKLRNRKGGSDVR